MIEQRSRDLVSTGIPGLDNVLLGGFMRGGFYLVQGDPGSGKTTLSLQFVQARLRAGDRCLYVSLTESRADLEAACQSHGWSLQGLEVRDLTRSAAHLEADSHVSVFHPADTELTDGISGYEVAEQLRADSSLAETALIALTGWGAPDDRCKAWRRGLMCI